MHKHEAEKIELALDGIMANLETLRTVIRQMCNETASQDEITPDTTTLTGDPDTCLHENIREIETMGGVQAHCFECGYAE